VRLHFPTSAFGVIIALFVLSLGFGCDSQPATAAASVARPLEASSDTATVPATAKPSKVSDQLGQTAPLVAPVVTAPLQRPSILPAAADPSDMSRNVQAVLDRVVSAVFRMDDVSWFGVAPFFTLAFATACWMGAAYGYLQGSWLVEIAGGIWGCLALRKSRRSIKLQNAAAHGAGRFILAWHVRLIGVLAVISGVVLLIVDSPLSARWPIPISRAVAEAMPLLLVGTAYLAWLAIDRPPAVDLVKQVLLALAFILWGVDLLIPASQWSRFLGAVVIAIYVFDLAWLMEGNLRKKFGPHLVIGALGCMSPHCRSAAVCTCDGSSENARAPGDGDRQFEVPKASPKK
jgi:hypothetical protein